MSKAKTAPVNYQALSQELESILLELQREDLDIDQAVAHYQRGLEVVQALEIYLKTAENNVKQLQVKFKAES